MPKLQSYRCDKCDKLYEYLHMGKEDPATCPTCASIGGDLQLGGKSLYKIVPDYPGSKKFKAGYVHSHGDRPAEKGSVAVPGKREIVK